MKLISLDFLRKIPGTNRRFPHCLGPVLVSLWFLSVGGLGAAEPPPLFKEAAVLYDQGQFDQAAARYVTLLANDIRSDHIYFNLGNAYFKAGQIGRAILNYERALQLAPRDRDIEGNLRFALNQGKGREEQSSGGWATLLAGLRDSLTTEEWVYWSCFNYWLTLIVAIAFVWLPAGIVWRRWLRPVMITFGVLAAICGTGWAAKAVVENGPPAGIVVVKEVVVRFAPVDGGSPHFTASEGQKLWIVQQRESHMEGVPGWLKVVRADGQEGWVPANTVEKI